MVENKFLSDVKLKIWYLFTALATCKEPVPGWIDTVQGFNRVIMGIAQ